MKKSEDKGKLKITLRRSLNGRNEGQKRTAAALGLKKISQSRVYPDSPQVRGMAEKLSHLVDVEVLG